MPDSLPFIYWDACVPLSYINGNEERIQHIAPLLQRSGEQFQIVTSVLSITEVAYAGVEKSSALLDPAIEAEIGNLWRIGGPIKLVEVYEQIAYRARRLMRVAVEKGWGLKPGDALHLATAEQLKVTEFHTYDKPLAKYSELTENAFLIRAPISSEPHLALGPLPPNT